VAPVDAADVGYEIALFEDRVSATIQPLQRADSRRLSAIISGRVQSSARLQAYSGRRMQRNGPSTLNGADRSGVPSPTAGERRV